jgi:hypothetical protein
MTDERQCVSLAALLHVPSENEVIRAAMQDRIFVDDYTFRRWCVPSRYGFVYTTRLTIEH